MKYLKLIIFIIAALVILILTHETDAAEATPATEPVTPATYAATREWTDEEKTMILKIAMAEAEGENTEGKALVMLTVLNRVQSPAFPNTIYGVIFQKNQFSPVKSGGRYWTTTPNTNCYAALDLILSGWDESYGALYFTSAKGSNWHSRNLTPVLECGNHKFYK